MSEAHVHNMQNHCVSKISYFDGGAKYVINCVHSTWTPFNFTFQFLQT